MVNFILLTQPTAKSRTSKPSMSMISRSIWLRTVALKIICLLLGLLAIINSSGLAMSPIILFLSSLTQSQDLKNARLMTIWLYPKTKVSLRMLNYTSQILKKVSTLSLRTKTIPSISKTLENSQWMQVTTSNHLVRYLALLSMPRKTFCPCMLILAIKVQLLFLNQILKKSSIDLTLTKLMPLKWHGAETMLWFSLSMIRLFLLGHVSKRLSTWRQNLAVSNAFKRLMV